MPATPASNAIATASTGTSQNARDGTLTRSGKAGVINRCSTVATATDTSATNTAWSARLESSVRLDTPTALSTAKSRWRSSADRYTTDPTMIAATTHSRTRTRSTEAIIRLLREIRSEGHLIVVSTHDARLVPIADRIVQMVPDLEDLARPRATRSLAAGESLFEQGDASDLVYVIDEGELDVIRVLVGGGEQHLARLGPGQYCGELGPLMGFPRSASARAATDVVLTVLSPHEFRERMLHR